MARRAAAITLVVVLLAVVVSSPFLFDAEEEPTRERDGAGGRERVDGEPSVYMNIALASSSCLPAAGPSSGSGGSSSVRGIADDVERLRGLEFEVMPEVEFMTPAALTNYVGDVAEEELAEADMDVQIAALEKLGLVPKDFELEEFIENTSTQVLGLYEPDSKRLLVGGSGSLEPLDQLTVAHELDHALTDEVLGFPELKWQAARSDAQLAERALIEGDATLLMQHYGMVEFPDDLQDLLTEGAGSEEIRAYENLPHLLRRSLSFPYLEGYLFSCQLHAEGGWKAIDRAYEEPPVSTLEILYPGLYGEVEPQEPRQPRSPGVGWTRAYSAALGAADLQWMFEAPGGKVSSTFADAARQVSRWRGGRFHIWERGEDLVVLMAIVEGSDLSRSDVPSICHRLVQWYTAARPQAAFIDGRGASGAWRSDGDVAAVYCDGDQTRLVIAPSLDTALRVARF